MGQLKKFTINMKSLDQTIGSPVIAGAGDMNGRSLVVLFSQEAQDQLAPETKVYLKWRHIQNDVRGYNVFTQLDKGDCFHPAKWEIKWPQAMLKEGDVLAHIELVDSVSIACSQNFTVHVLSDPDDGSHFVAGDDYTEFKAACIELATLGDSIEAKFDEYQAEFEHWRADFADIRKTANAAYQKAYETAQDVKEVGYRLTDFQDRVDKDIRDVNDRIDNIEVGDMSIILNEY